MTELMLTREEVERLTGRKRTAAQVRWLERQGLRYRRNDCDEIIVARALAEKFLGVERKPRVPADLDWRAMRRLGIVTPRGEATKA